jgi:ElaB/YqjD/DUF883 family membrane-anchored ribosome-binding protein
MGPVSKQAILFSIFTEVTIMETLDNLTNTAEEAAEKISSAASQAAEALSEKGEQLAEAVSEKGKQLMTMEEQFLKNCRAYVKDNPMTAVGIALAAGFILSQIMNVGEHRRG